MDALEGSRRMQVAGRWIVFAVITVILLLLGTTMLSNLFHAPIPPELAGLFVPMFVVVAIPGAGLWLAGWIVEGFARK